MCVIYGVRDFQLLCSLLNMQGTLFITVLFAILYVFADINECDSNPCENDGACMDMEDGYKCKCESGFNGTRCEMGKVCYSRAEYL